MSLYKTVNVKETGRDPRVFLLIKAKEILACSKLNTDRQFF